jgi:hypothetical protein
MCLCCSRYIHLCFVSSCCSYLGEVQIFVTSHVVSLSVSAFCCLLLYLAKAFHVLVMSNLWPVSGGELCLQKLKSGKKIREALRQLQMLEDNCLMIGERKLLRGDCSCCICWHIISVIWIVRIHCFKKQWIILRQHWHKVKSVNCYWCCAVTV